MEVDDYVFLKQHIDHNGLNIINIIAGKYLKSIKYFNYNKSAC